jgi:dienelactone hydrolase
MGSSRVSLVFLCLLVCVLGQLASGEEATQEEYEERLERYDLVSNPTDHGKLASWCKRNYPGKHRFHLRKANRIEFKLEEAKLSGEPLMADLEKMKELAEKLELVEEERTYAEKWGSAKFAEFSQRMKPGSIRMQKQLLTWFSERELTSVPEVRQLAEDILAREESYLPARKALGHFEWKGEWMTRKEAIASIGIYTVKERVELHEALAESRSKKEMDYPMDPFEDMEELDGYYQFSPRKSPHAQFFVCENGYRRSKPSRLIISLHGGGSDRNNTAEGYAKIGVKEWKKVREDQVVLAPVATQHVTDSWGTLSNMEEILDALEEICERFNIDRKRIYVTGQSMGGGGTALWYACFPEFAAASCGRAGWFHHTKKQASLLNKPILVIQGEKDEGFRIDSKHKFLKMAENCGGDVTNISFPNTDHFLTYEQTFEEFLPYFEKHVNDIEPDFEVIREAARAWFKN